MYISATINQITGQDGGSLTLKISDDKYFVINHLGFIYEATLIVCDFYIRLAIFRVIDDSNTLKTIHVPKQEIISVGVRVYVLAWRLHIDACSIMLGSVSNPKFTYNGVHDDIFINVSDFFKNNDDNEGGIKSKYGGAVFSEKDGSFVGIVHWTRLGNSYGVLPARQIYKSLLSLQYEILPNLVEDDLPELSATNEYFLGVHGRRLDPIRNVVLNEAYRLNSVIAKKGNIGTIVTDVLQKSPASNARIIKYTTRQYLLDLARTAAVSAAADAAAAANAAATAAYYAANVVRSTNELVLIVPANVLTAAKTAADAAYAAATATASAVVLLTQASLNAAATAVTIALSAINIVKAAIDNDNSNIATIIWALREHECDPWTYIDEHNSFESFVEIFSPIPKHAQFLNTISHKKIYLFTSQTKTIQLLTSRIDDPKKLTEVSVTLERA